MRSYSLRDRPVLKPPGRNETDQEEWVEFKEKKARSSGKNTGQDRDRLSENKDLGKARYASMLLAPGR